jgi:chromosome segregation protein
LSVHLKSLTLKGFKSFAQPTTFAFEPGVTCVVGPNGSGKSNVVDGLAWVMGEQGAKTLRGGSMEDVIFAGTTSKAPLGRAEVMLTIDNSDGALPIDYSEVTISRTLFRNGASEYAINKEPVRLLDVQELLSDSGLGREMHVIVGQGQLDRVLHASPDDRRRFIEEAAGILKHRRRKEKTQRKLESMQANLTRLNDLAGEIRRQLTPLGRQADIAKQAQSIQAIVRDAKARVLADDVVALGAAIASFHLNEQERATERAALGDQADTGRRRMAELEAGAGNDDLDKARGTDFAIRRVYEGLQALESLATERAGGGDEESPGGVLHTISDQVLDDLAADLERAGAAVTAHEATVGNISARLATHKASLASLDNQTRETTEAANAWDSRARVLETARERALGLLTSSAEDLARQEDALERAKGRATEAEGVLESVQSGGGSSSDIVAQAFEHALAEAEEFLRTAEEAEQTTRSSFHQLEREHEALAATVSALDLALHTDTGDDDLSEYRGITGRVSDALTVKPGYETAIARALGSLTDAFLVESRSAALDVVSARSGGDTARVELVISDGKATATPEVPGVIAATQLVTGPGGVIALLRGTYVAEDIAAVTAAWGGPSKLPSGVIVVTRSGDVFGEHVVQTGSGQARSRLELAAERDSAHSDLTLRSIELERSRFAASEAGDKKTVAAERVTQARAELRAADVKRAELSEHISSARASLEAARAEISRLEENFRRAGESLESAREAQQAAGVEHEAFLATERPVIDHARRQELVDALDAVSTEEVDARIGLEALRQGVRQASESLRVAQVRKAEEEAAKAREEAKYRDRVAKAKRASAVLAVLPDVLALVRSSVEESAAALVSAEAHRQASQGELTDLRAKDVTLRERLASITESVHSLEMQIYEKKLQRTTLLERVNLELGLSEAVLLEEYSPDSLVPGESEDEEGTPFDRAVQEARLAKASRQLDVLGKVNPLALEEFNALEDRHTFLKEQLEDLSKTRKDLESIMEDLDKTMQAIFADAFADTQAAFDEVFPILFPGGTGSLSLTAPDDLLTTGIDVSVRPAGKKIERLSLLSGGERSLAAVALLIAIFKARPSPFYILDEVEAALDDANLGRLLSVIESLRKDSQLIVITHQKRTMEIADALYGVSMRADGVSAVVGQRVTDREALAS